MFATDERRIMSGIAFHHNALGNSIQPCFFCWHGSMGFPKTTMKGHSQHNPLLIGRKNQVKFENDCVLTNGHRIKITPSNLMSLVSFSSAGVAWFEDVKRYGTFRSQATENPPFRFYGTPGIVLLRIQESLCYSNASVATIATYLYMYAYKNYAV